MLINAIARQIEGIVHLVFYGAYMSGCMFFDVLDDLSGVLFQMIGVFDEGFAGAGDGIVCHKVLGGVRVLVRVKNRGFRLAKLQ